MTNYGQIDIFLNCIIKLKIMQRIINKIVQLIESIRFNIERKNRKNGKK
jgi:hypothetical protein